MEINFLLKVKTKFSLLRNTLKVCTLQMFLLTENRVKFCGREISLLKNYGQISVEGQSFNE